MQCQGAKKLLRKWAAQKSASSAENTRRPSAQSEEGDAGTEPFSLKVQVRNSAVC